MFLYALKRLDFKSDKVNVHWSAGFDQNQNSVFFAFEEGKQIQEDMCEYQYNKGRADHMCGDREKTDSNARSEGCPNDCM